jgi:hypothetical protein
MRASTAAKGSAWLRPPPDPRMQRGFARPQCCCMPNLHVPLPWWPAAAMPQRLEGGLGLPRQAAAAAPCHPTIPAADRLCRKARLDCWYACHCCCCCEAMSRCCCGSWGGISPHWAVGRQRQRCHQCEVDVGHAPAACMCSPSLVKPLLPCTPLSACCGDHAPVLLKEGLWQKGQQAVLGGRGFVALVGMVAHSARRIWSELYHAGRLLMLAPFTRKQPTTTALRMWVLYVPVPASHAAV